MKKRNCFQSICSRCKLTPVHLYLLYLFLALSVTLSPVTSVESQVKTSIGTIYIEPNEPVSNSYSLNCLIPNVISDIEGGESNVTQTPMSTPVPTSVSKVNPMQLFEQGTCQWNFSGFIYSTLPDSTVNEYALFAPLTSNNQQQQQQQQQGQQLASMSTPWINGSSIISESCKMLIEYRITNSLDPFDVVIDSPSNGQQQSMTVIAEMRPSQSSDIDWSSKSIPLFKTQPKGPFRIIIELSKLRARESVFLNETYAAIRRVEFIHCFNTERKIMDSDRCYYECGHELSLINTPQANWFRENATNCIDRVQMCNLINECPMGEDEKYNCNLIPSTASVTFKDCPVSKRKNSGLTDICGWVNCEFHHGTYREIFGSNRNKWTLNRNNSGANFIEAQFISTANKYSDLALIKSPTYEPIPFYHSNDTSSYFNSCQLTFKHLITRKSVSLVVKFVSPELTVDESAHQSTLLLNLEKSIGPFKHPLKLSPHIWQLFSIFRGHSKDKTTHKSHILPPTDSPSSSSSSSFLSSSSIDQDDLGHGKWSHVTVPLPMFVHSRYFIVIEANSGYSGSKLNGSLDSSSIIAVTDIILSKECFGIDVPYSEGIIHPYVKSYTVLYVTLFMIIFILLTISIVTLIVLYKKKKLTSNYTSGVSEVNEMRSVGRAGPGSTSTVASRYAINATYYSCASIEASIADLFQIPCSSIAIEK